MRIHAKKKFLEPLSNGAKLTHSLKHTGVKLYNTIY